MSLVTDMTAALATLQGAATKWDAIVQGPASGGSSQVSTTSGTVKTLARRLAEGFWAPPVNWLTATAYVALPPMSLVVQGGEVYACAIAHTSGTFATDLAANRWVQLTSHAGDITALQAADTAADGRLDTLEGRADSLDDRVLPVLITSNHTVTKSNEYLEVDTTAGEITVQLKASPSDRDKATLVDLKGKFATHNLIVAGNGKTIGGTATSVRCGEAIPVVLVLEFDSTADTWRPYVMT